MESRVKVLGHPLHTMMVMIPFGLLAGSVLFDLIALVTDNPALHYAAFWMIGIGVLAGVAAAIPGAIDFFTIPRHTRAWRVGALHGAGNLAMVALFAISWILRRELPSDPDAIPLTLSVIAFGLACATGWLGGELVDRLGVGVDDGANLDAPSSLSGRSTTDRGTYTPATRRTVEP